VWVLGSVGYHRASLTTRAHRPKTPHRPKTAPPAPLADGVVAKDSPRAWEGKPLA